MTRRQADAERHQVWIHVVTTTRMHVGVADRSIGAKSEFELSSIGLFRYGLQVMQE
jgi:hypothetical protein